ncbi:MAG: hypothetical protein ACRC33_28240 [Gemmataceae bacterium]
MTTTMTPARPAAERAMDLLRRAGNPFRNYFARNADDDICARYHVHELYALQREQLLAVVDLYRYSPATHSEVIPVLGNKGAGKTHLLYSIKHGNDGAWQLLITPGTYQKDAEFLEYLLFQLIDTLLGGGKQRDTRPLEYVGEEVVRGLLTQALTNLPAARRLELFPMPGLGWTRHFGLGTGQAQDRARQLIDALSRPLPLPFQPGAVRRVCDESGLGVEKAMNLLMEHIDRTEPRNTAGLMRRHIFAGFARAMLQGDETDLATFLTYGFAELEFQVRPSRQDLVLALFKSLMSVLQALRVPVVFAFDQLEDLLLARRSDDSHRVAEAFFAGLVQAMHQLNGIAFLVFAERGLWNRFVPSLDGYIQDRLNNPIHLAGHGTLSALKLEAPPADLVSRVVEARLRPGLQSMGLGETASLPPLFPFTPEQVERVAKTEPTLRDMLQQYRQLFDAIVFRTGDVPAEPAANRLPPEPLPVPVKSVVVVNAAPASSKMPLAELWEQEVRAARRKLEPDGALTGATRELQAGLGAFLRVGFEQGFKVGPWRISHVVPEWTFGDHPTYGVLSLAHWVCRGGTPWKVGVGLFMAKAAAKPRDLQTKLAALEVEPAVVEHLILLRPEDDLSLSGKSKSLWQEAEKRGRPARLEPVSLEAFSVLYAFPRIVSSLTESLAEGQPMPSLAEMVQERCEKLLEQVCLPIAE